MKKAFSLLSAVLIVIAFVACGQSEEDKKKDSLQMDSVTKETLSTGDSLIEMMERENELARLADSSKQADSIAAAGAPKP